MKKLISLTLALLLILTLAVGASAATITVNGASGQTYEAYKIFDLVWKDDGDNQQEATDGYGYSISGTSPWYNDVKNYTGLIFTQSATAGTYTVTFDTSFDAAAFAAHLLGKVSGKTEDASGTIASDATSVDLTVTDPGYYFVTTTLGSLCMLDTAASSVTVNEKNSDTPLAQKTVKEDETDVYGTTSVAQIGQTVEFKTTIDVKYNPTEYVLHDIMSAGLSFNEDSLVVKVGDTTLQNGVEYSLDTSSANYTFELSFVDASMKYFVGKQIVVTYTATLNENAVIAGDGNTNTIHLSYKNVGNNAYENTNPDVTTTYTYQFDLVKTDSDKKVLDGAKFKLYDAATAGNEIPVVKVSDGVYRLAKSGETGVDIETVSGEAVIQGLDSQTYYLEETAAPAGYNKLTARKAVTISGANLDATVTDGVYTQGGIHIENKTGTALPETGAFGTMLFITFGIVVMLATGVLLVTKKRMSMIQE